jgi:hypothetical protein
MMESVTESARKRESRRIMREKRNAAHENENAAKDQTPGAGPSKLENAVLPVEVARKRKRSDDSSTVPSPTSHAHLTEIAVNQIDPTPSDDPKQNSRHHTNTEPQTPIDDEVDVMLASIALKKTELEAMKGFVSHHRREARKNDIAVEELRPMVDGLKQTVEELRGTAETMQKRNHELEAQIEMVCAAGVAQEKELHEARIREEELKREKAKALEGQESYRSRLLKILGVHELRDAAGKTRQKTSDDATTESGLDGARNGKFAEQKAAAENTDIIIGESKGVGGTSDRSGELEERIQGVKEELDASLSREGELRRDHEAALNDLRERIADLTAVNDLLKKSTRPDVEVASIMDPGAAEHASRTREMQALEKVKQHKAHNVELKMARDVMRKKLIVIEAARVEFQTTLAETKAALAESQAALAASRVSNETSENELAALKVTHLASQQALASSNRELLKAQEQCHHAGLYAERWKSVCMAEREAGAHLLSRLTVAGTAVNDAINKAAHVPFQATANATFQVDFNGALRNEAAQNVDAAMFKLMALINVEINRRVGLGQNKDWVGLQAMQQMSTVPVPQVASSSGSPITSTSAVPIPPAALPTT